MREPQRVFRFLVDRFFRRFFDNDTIQVEGDTLTTVVRAIAATAVPGLMVAFFLQTRYPHRPLWMALQDRYFFVLWSLVVMGAVSIFEWEMLFPDRLDFLILSPLSVKPVQMLAAKAAALMGFLLLFLLSCNVFGTLILSAVTKDVYFRQVFAHGAAVFLAGLFAASFFLALCGILLCVLDAARFRIASPIVQMFSVMVLVLLTLHFALYGDSIRLLLSQPQGIVRAFPPFWFLGVYEWLLSGDAAPAFAHEMARYALLGTATSVLLALLTYPLAWARMRRMALEGTAHTRRQPSPWLAQLIHSAVRRPGERAVFHFIGQSIARTNRYQVYLAMYSGTGLALAIACAVTFRTTGGHLQAVLTNEGLHAVPPLLLFWVIAGLRTAFAFPLNLRAGWIFRITGVTMRECTSAARKWVLLCAMGVLCSILAVLILAGWDARHLFVQAVCGGCLCSLLTDGFFLLQQSVPFNKPRMPGRTNLPLALTLYVAIFPPMVLGVVHIEMQIEKHLAQLLWLVLFAALVHAATSKLNRGTEEIEEEMEGYDGEFQLLGLSLR